MMVHAGYLEPGFMEQGGDQTTDFSKAQNYDGFNFSVHEY